MERSPAFPFVGNRGREGRSRTAQEDTAGGKPRYSEHTRMKPPTSPQSKAFTTAELNTASGGVHGDAFRGFAYFLCPCVSCQNEQVHFGFLDLLLIFHLASEVFSLHGLFVYLPYWLHYRILFLSLPLLLNMFQFSKKFILAVTKAICTSSSNAGVTTLTGCCHPLPSARFSAS